HRTSAAGAKTHGTRISAARNIIRKREQCAGRRIFLCSVVNLPAPCAIGFFASEAARRFGYQRAKMMQANRKIRSPHDAADFRGCVFTQLWQLAKQSGRSRAHWTRRLHESS